VREVQLDGLPPELDGLRIVHLSDFHLGPLSRGRRAVAGAVAWTRERRPDLVCITGDLLSHPRALGRLRELLRGLDAYVVLGNHDVGVTRDRFSRAVDLDELPATVLLDEARIVEVRGRRVQIHGVNPRSYSERKAVRIAEPDASADLRILLCHFPGIARKLRPNAFDLVLAGHMHDGQICLPYPGGKIRLAHPRARVVVGEYRYGRIVLHVSPGLGTTFVPFRFFARPEVTELVLRAAPMLPA